MANISKQKVCKHGFSSEYDKFLFRSYKRIDGKFIPIGFFCDHCNKVYIDKKIGSVRFPTAPITNKLILI